MAYLISRRLNYKRTFDEFFKKQRLGAMAKKHKCSIILVSTLIIIIFYVFISFLGNQSTINYVRTKFNIDKLQTIDAWMFGNEEIATPMTIPSDHIKISTILPDNLDGKYLSFSSHDSIHKIYINGELIYSYGDEKQLPFGNMSGNIRCMIPLNKSYEGQLIEWEIESLYTSSIYIPTTYVDGKAQIILEIILENLWKIILISILLAMCIGIVSFWLLRNKEQSLFNRDILLYYVLFTLAIVFWLYLSSDLPQFFTDKNEMISCLSFLSLAYIPIIYNKYFQALYQKELKSLNILIWFGFANLVTNCVLFVLDLVDMPQIMMITHLNMVSILVVILIISCQNRKKDVYLNIEFYGVIVFTVFASIALIVFVHNPFSNLVSISLLWGYSSLTICNLFIIVKKEKDLTKELINIQLYKTLAYVDGLTNLQNRASFERKLDEIEASQQNEYIGLIMADVNNLKKVNDNLGHNEGDKLIKSAANCLNETFEQIGECYRIGGDEFVIIISNPKINIPSYIEKLKENILLHNKTSHLELSISIGFAGDYWDKSNTNFRKDIYKKADDMMYEMKKEYHKIHGGR